LDAPDRGAPSLLLLDPRVKCGVGALSMAPDPIGHLNGLEGSVGAVQELQQLAETGHLRGDRLLCHIRTIKSSRRRRLRNVPTHQNG
jgi:hypothetical protein